MKTAATSADQGVLSNNEQIMAWFGHCLLCSLLYISPWQDLCKLCRVSVSGSPWRLQVIDNRTDCEARTSSAQWGTDSKEINFKIEKDNLKE